MKREFPSDVTAPPEADSEHDQLIQRLLNDPEKQEVLSWLKGADDRTIGGCKGNQDSIRFAQEIYGLGASEIFAVNIHPNQSGTGRRSGKLVVKLPNQPAARQAIFDWCERQGDSMGFTPDPDGGESHLFLLLD
jgi:hypothetical protein